MQMAAITSGTEISFLKYEWRDSADSGLFRYFTMAGFISWLPKLTTDSYGCVPINKKFYPPYCIVWRGGGVDGSSKKPPSTSQSKRRRHLFARVACLRSPTSLTG